jgi:hypothetical protein
MLSVDTLLVNIKEISRPATRIHLTHAVKYDDRYFCFFKENGLYSFKIDTRYFLIISEEGTILHNIDVPKEINNTVYFDFFIRKDSLLAKTYSDHESFYFDLNNLEWEVISEIDDRVYEDKDFIIAYRDFGEWGQTTWFIDKKSKNEYIIGACGTIVNFLNGRYYLTFTSGIREIINPFNLKKCETDYYYEIVEKNEKFYEGTNSLVGSTLIYKDTTYSSGDFDLPKNRIITSFVSDNQLYQLYSDSTSLYIAKIEHDEIIPIHDFGRKYSIFNWFYSFRGNNLDNNYRFLKFREDNNTFGFIEINNNKIGINYLISHRDSLEYLGSDGLEQLLDFVLNKPEMLLMEQVDSIENNLGGIDMKNDRTGISHNGYYPEIYGSMNVKTKEYIKVQDSFIAQTTEYLYLTPENEVKSIYLKWSLTESYNQTNTYNLFKDENTEFIERLKRKLQEIEQIITKQFGKEPKKKNRGNDNFELSWISENGYAIKLYGSDTFKGRKEIRMIINKEQ